MSIISQRGGPGFTFARTRRQLLKLAIAVLPLAALTLVPATSQASALGYEYWGAFDFKG